MPITTNFEVYFSVSVRFKIMLLRPMENLKVFTFHFNNEIPVISKAIL